MLNILKLRAVNKLCVFRLLFDSKNDSFMTLTEFVITT